MDLPDPFPFRQAQGGPVKRMVQPHVVQTGLPTHTTTSTGSAAPPVNNDAVTTAAVAASAAVAATQPFLRVSV